MSQCEYFSLWDREKHELTEWGTKLSARFKTEVDDEDKRRDVQQKVTEYPELYERESINKDSVTNDEERALRKAEATRKSAGLPVTCPHERVTGEDYCEFHISPSRYGDHDGLNGQSVCESFLRTIRDAEEDNNERVKCFAGGRFEQLSLSYRTLTSQSNRPVQLQYAEIGKLDMDAAVIDELLLLDGSNIGSVSCENVRFRRRISFEDVEIDCETILFANSIFHEEVSFRNAHLSATKIDFQQCTFESVSRFSSLEAKLKRGTKQEFIDFAYTTFDGEFDCSDSTFFFSDRVDDTAEPYVDFFQCSFTKNAKLNDCKFISGEKTQESVTLFESMANQASEDTGDEDHDSQWVLLFKESEFDKGIEVGNTTVEGDIKFPQVDFGRGEIVFENVDVNGKADFEQTLFSGKEANFSELTVRESLDMSGAVYSVSGGRADFSNLIIEGRINFSQTTLTGNEIDFSGGRIAIGDSQDSQDGSVSADFHGTDLEGGETSFNKTVFGGPTSYDYATITGEECCFNQVEVAGDLTFKHAEFHTTRTDFTKLRVKNASNFDMSNSNYISNAVIFKRMEITCDTKIQFASANFECEASFDNTVFKCKDIDFSKVSSESGELNFVGVQSGDSPIDFTDATVMGGSFVIAEHNTVYDFTDATIGDINLMTRDGEAGADGKLFKHFIFKNTEFDGFDFSDDRVNKQLKRTRWAIHTSHRGKDSNDKRGFVGGLMTSFRQYYRLFAVGPDKSVDPNELEATYMKAKLGANQKGDPDAVSQFFQKELHFRRRTYAYQFWDRSQNYGSLYQSAKERIKIGWDWFANMTLWLSVGYGESPRNVVLTSIFVISVFAGIYKTIDALPSGTNTIDYITYSFQGFIQLLFGVQFTGGIFVRLVTAVEGFIGAFVIALFVITLTRSINR